LARKFRGRKDMDAREGRRIAVVAAFIFSVLLNFHCLNKMSINICIARAAVASLSVD
jgi:hypothetical protein